jgi:hypothetical protein
VAVIGEDVFAKWIVALAPLLAGDMTFRKKVDDR